MLLSMLDQEDGFNAYLVTGRATSLARYEHGRRALEVALARSEATQKEPEEVPAIRRQRGRRGSGRGRGGHLNHLAASASRG